MKRNIKRVAALWMIVTFIAGTLPVNAQEVKDKEVIVESPDSVDEEGELQSQRENQVKTEKKRQIKKSDQTERQMTISCQMNLY